jgi:uncharacterized Zn finger protein
MSDTTERVAAACPGCDAETVHEVLKPGGQATVRCTDCGHTHKVRIEEERTVDVDVVVSQDGESFPTSVEAPAEERVAVGDEFVADTPEAIMQVRITALELDGDRRVEEAAAEAVETVWTRAVDNVSVAVTVHPTDGRRDGTRSETVYVPGDHEFVVGERASLGDESVEVEGVQVRDDASGYHVDKFDREGDIVLAKDVKRLYARDERERTWSPW